MLREIFPGFFLLPGENDGRFPYSHSFLVQGDSCALLDTGAGIERLRWLCDQVPIDMVITSHSHPDHTAGNWMFKEVPLYAPCYAADTYGRLVPLSERCVKAGALAETWRRFVSQSMHFRDALPTHTFSDGAVFDLGRVRLVAIHTPGHVLDHVCFFEPKHGVLLSYDIDLTSFGPWYGHRESDIEQFKTSIRRVMALKPKIVISSHKGVIRDDVQEHLSRFLGVFDSRQTKIRDLLAAGHTVNEILELSPFYGGYPYARELLRYWEEQMIRKHIELL